jgi:ABC-type phosphate transport system substrate-binding protein
MRTRTQVLVMVLGLLLAPLTHAAAVLVVSAQSPVTTLSEDQVAAIFLGKMAVLPDGTRLVPVDLAEGNPARTNFYARFVGKSESQLRAYWARLIFSGAGQPPQVIRDVETLKKLLAEHPDWVGYLDRADLDRSVRQISPGGKS